MCIDCFEKAVRQEGGVMAFEFVFMAALFL